jgi:hypothetical protein
VNRAAWPAVLLAVLSSHPLAAQGLVHWLGGTGSLGTDVAVSRNDAAADGSYRVWLVLPFAGSLADERILSYRASVRPVLRWQTLTGQPGTLTAREFDVNADARMLGGRPLSLGVSGHRASAVAGGGFGSSRETSSGGATLDAWWRLPILTTQASYRVEHTRESWQNPSGAAPFVSDAEVRAWRLGLTTSKLSLTADRMRYDNAVTGATLSALNVLGTHQVRWGKGSRLESTVEHAEQDGAYALDRTAWTERVHLQQTRAVGTDLSYHRTTTAGRLTNATVSQLAGGVTAQIARALSAGIQAARAEVGAGDARESALIVTPRVGLVAALPGGGRAWGDASLGVERRDRTGSADAFVPAVDERHRVPAVRTVVLDQPDADPASVAVRAANGTPLEAGLDYAVETAGGVRVNALPSGRINVGDDILITYRYRVTGAGRQDALAASWGGSVALGGLTVRHRTQLRVTRGAALGPLGSALPGAENFDETQTGATFAGGTPIGRLDLDATFRTRHGATLRMEGWEANAAYLLPSLGPISASFAGGWSRSVSGSGEAGGLSGLATLRYVASDRLQVGGTVEVLRWTQADAPAQRFVRGALTAAWHVGAIEVNAQLDTERHGAAVTHTMSRAQLMVRRSL